MAQQHGQDRERIKMGDAFNSFAVTQPEPIDVGPFQQVTPEVGAQSKFNEDHVVVAAPVLDIAPQAGQAGKEPLELRLRSLDPDRARRKWLH